MKHKKAAKTNLVAGFFLFLALFLVLNMVFFLGGQFITPEPTSLFNTLQTVIVQLSLYLVIPIFLITDNFILSVIVMSGVFLGLYFWFRGAA